MRLMIVLEVDVDDAVRACAKIVLSPMNGELR
jgi:hypothetical protein